jgi:hypothetical protein
MLPNESLSGHAFAVGAASPSLLKYAGSSRAGTQYRQLVSGFASVNAIHVVVYCGGM